MRKPNADAPMGSVFFAARRAGIGHWRRWGPIEIAAMFHVACQLYERMTPWQKVLIEQELRRRCAAALQGRTESNGDLAAGGVVD
jgi:hypothetical protein